MARLDLGIDARSIDLYVLRGTPAADPVRRNLTRNETVWELGLADIYLPKGIATISQARISDTRLETKRCGAVAPFVELDTTALYDQLKQATADAVDAMQDALGGTTAGNLQHYRRSLRVETEIPSGADLNTYQDAGNFGCSVVSNVATIANKPSGLSAPFLLFVHSVGSSIMQEIVDSKGSRWCRAGTGEWDQTYDSRQIIPVENGGTGATSGSSALSNLGIKKWLLDNVFKVGYVWVSYTSTSPASIIGGTWTAITGRFPYFNAGTSVGGSNTHTLTVDQMPKHEHGIRLDWFNYAGSGIDDSYSSNTNAQLDAGGSTREAGGGGSHNNMPAYQTLYAWRRTA